MAEALKFYSPDHVHIELRYKKYVRAKILTFR